MARERRRLDSKEIAQVAILAGLGMTVEQIAKQLGRTKATFVRLKDLDQPEVQLALESSRTPERRFWSKVEKTETCWNWIGARNNFGYGVVQRDGRRHVAHRVAYEMMVGQVPEGLDLDHLCRNRACCNPAHLEPVTRQVNVLRGVSVPAQNAAKTHCRHGHALSGENLLPSGLKRGHRLCRTCAADRERRKYHERKRAEAG